MDHTAGGGPQYISWRNNHQWLIGVSKDTTVTMQLTVAAGEDAKGLFHLPIGLMVLRGNTGDDAKRRKLLLTDSNDFVARVEPQYTRRLSAQVGRACCVGGACCEVGGHASW